MPDPNPIRRAVANLERVTYDNRWVTYAKEDLDVLDHEAATDEWRCSKCEPGEYMVNVAWARPRCDRCDAECVRVLVVPFREVPVPDDPSTRSVEMTQAQREAFDRLIRRAKLPVYYEEALADAVARFDAAVARPAEAERRTLHGDFVRRDGTHVDTITVPAEAERTTYCGFPVNHEAHDDCSGVKPAEPVRTVRWCETHNRVVGAVHHPGDCRISTRVVGGETTP